MNDFDSSLPSNSNFFDTSNYNTSGVLRASWHSDEGRGQSPPPPPPSEPPNPPLSNQVISDFQSDRGMNPAGTDSQLTGEKNVKKRTGPFPFLKKFSRQEPTAKNKLAVRKPTVGDGSSNEKQRIDAPITFNNPSSSQQTYRNKDKKFNDDGEEIVQQGSGYWGLNSSAIQFSDKVNSTSGDLRASMASTSSIRFRNNLAAGVEEFRKELEEFEMMERQLEGLAFDEVDEQGTGLSAHNIRDASRRRESISGDSRLDISSTNNITQEKDSSSYLNSTQVFRNTNLRAPLSGDRSTKNESEASWGAVTQPIPNIVPDRSTDSLNYTSSYENKVRHSSSAAVALPYSHLDKHRSLEGNLPSSSSLSFPTRNSQQQAYETADAEDIHIIRTRPLSGNRAQSARGGGSGSTTPTMEPHSAALYGRGGGPQQPQQQLQLQIQQQKPKQPSNDAIPPTLALKAKELEEELETYRNENSALKKLRKQQENTLTDIVQQREQAIKWAAEEKQKTLAWCEEQKQLIAKERRAAAKIIRDVKEKTLTTTSSTRREKTEIEGLQAALHKAKIDHEASAKKWKSNESRLYSLIKDHSKHIEDLEKKITTLEEEKLLLLEFIQESNLHIPKHIRAKLQSTLLNASLSSGKATAAVGSAVKGRTNTPTQRRTASYVEEVDVDIVPSASSTVHRPGSVQGRGADRPGKVADTSRSSTMRLSRPSSIADDGKLSKTIGASAAHPRRDGSNALVASTSSWSRSSGATRSSGRYSLGSEDLDAAEADDEDLIDEIGNAEGNNVVDDYDQFEGGTNHRSTEDFTQSNFRSQESKQELGYTANTRQSGAYLLADTQPSKATIAILNSVSAASSYHQGGMLTNTSKGVPTLETVDYDKASMTTGLGSSNSKQTLSYTSSTNIGGERDLSRFLTQSSSAQLSTTVTSGSIPTNQNNIGNRSGDNTNHIIASNNSNSRMEEILPNGAKLIRYANGTTKEISHDGRSAMVRFTNGDYKHTDTVSGVVIYYYKLADTTHTTYKDGMEVYEFPNKQIEKHYPNGVKEILFPDSTKKLIRPDGVQESFFPDGVVLRELPDGKKEILNNLKS